MHTWLCRKLGDSFTAADLAHDTFLRVLRRGLADAIQSPRAYLTVIAGGLVNDHWRRRALEQAWLDELAARPEMFEPSLEERAVILETLDQIARLIDGLPALAREAFLLSQLDGLTYPQIAERLAISVNRVQKAMTQAVKHCYRAMHG
ncbi:sigma-70 family RNA polymerase sigma factor [Verticiella sediminum]|uniref:sigma-70 family RNA polymerase sigma factor n=1 Tax=Verticiella sediminum TaxID=1247510 RepID=UPI00319E496C